jgi:hypothetical protein
MWRLHPLSPARGAPGRIWLQGPGTARDKWGGLRQLIAGQCNQETWLPRLTYVIGSARISRNDPW